MGPGTELFGVPGGRTPTAGITTIKQPVLSHNTSSYIFKQGNMSLPEGRRGEAAVGVLASARYGKDKVRVFRVVRDATSKVHDVVEYNVTVLVEGAIETRYGPRLVDRPASNIVATATRKQTIPSLLRQTQVRHSSPLFCFL